ncbi:MAG: ORF6N domain-containing protein [Desulfobacterales bacterium]
MVPIERITSKIYLIRNVKVMLDRDLAELYDVETKALKQAVRRNIDRFPEDFMFELTKDELGNWRSQFATSNQDIMGLRIPPFVFTEHGILMLSSEKPKKKIGYTVKEKQKNLRQKVMRG